MRIRIVHIAGMLILAGMVATGMNALSYDAKEDQDNYRPLREGLTLHEISQRKLHHGRVRFINPWAVPDSRGLFNLLMWKLFSRNDFKESYKDEPITPVSIDWQRVREHQGLSVTFITHATVLIKDAGTYILIDPVLSGLGWRIKDYTPLTSETIAGMPKPDYVLITHSHYDHLDTSSLALFKDSSRFVTPLGYRDIMQDIGVQNHRELDWYDCVSDGIREITLLPCNHWSYRNPLVEVAPNLSLWGSYIIKTASGPTIYVSGDTAYFDRFDEIGREFDIDLAIINVGAYEPRWFMKYSHMNPSEAVRAFTQLGAKMLMPVHWGTFRLGDEPVHFPPIDIRKEMERAGLKDKLVDIRHGQTLFFDDQAQNP